MTTWQKKYDLASWSEFKELVGKVVSENQWGADAESYWFRGHAVSHWPLKSSFDRLFDGVDPPRRRNLHQFMIDSFRDRLDVSEDARVLETFDRLQLSSNESTDITALVQHYGAPTRMLDWSESPYISAFFAFADIARGFDGDFEDEGTCAVVALNTRAGAWNSDSGVSLVRTDRRTNQRLRHQRGVFTLNNSTHSSLEDYCADYYSRTPPAAPALYQIRMPREEARWALRDLELMGITSESMFPGLEGAARYALVRAVDRHVWRAE